MMMRHSIMRAAAVILAGGIANGCSGGTPPPAAAVSPVERGQYLVTITSCNDCHTPFKMGPNGPEPDMSRQLSGHPAALALPPPPAANQEWPWGGSATNTAFYGPWGISYAANLTPDQQTGLGGWTEDMFIRALRLGKHLGNSRPIQPPMPWPWVGKMTDEDLKAMYAYLRSIPSISNAVPPWAPPAK
jgi:mono/diheme cytochrome c family protein